MIKTIGKLVAIGALIYLPVMLIFGTPHTLCACLHPAHVIVGGTKLSSQDVRNRVMKRVPMSTAKADLAKALWVSDSAEEYFSRYCRHVVHGNVTCRFALERQAWFRGVLGYELHFIFSENETVSEIQVNRFKG